MSQIIKQNTELSTVLDSLAQEAQYYAKSFFNSTLQLGRVLTEAKPLVRHGEWQNWVRENTGLSPRSAQTYMQAYARYGDNPAISQIGECGKIFKLLALPEGTEEQFLSEHNTADMSVREVEAAVKKVKEEMTAQLEAERARAEADYKALHNTLLKTEEKLRMGSGTPPAIPDEVKTMLHDQARSIEEKNAEIARVAEIGRQALQDANRLRQENAALQQEVAERDEMLAESQEEYNQVQAALLNMQSAAAKGDAERIPSETLSFDTFASAVRQFIGSCARLPQMRHRFACMDMAEKGDWDELLAVIEKWAKDSREALNTLAVEEVQIHE